MFGSRLTENLGVNFNIEYMEDQSVMTDGVIA